MPSPSRSQCTSIYIQYQWSTQLSDYRILEQNDPSSLTVEETKHREKSPLRILQLKYTYICSLPRHQMRHPPYGKEPPIKKHCDMYKKLTLRGVFLIRTDPETNKRTSPNPKAFQPVSTPITAARIVVPPIILDSSTISRDYTQRPSCQSTRQTSLQIKCDSQSKPIIHLNAQNPLTRWMGSSFNLILP